MRKIPTLFVRDENDRRHVTREVNPGCEWVLNGEGASTRKFDGTCCKWDGKQWWVRREVKPGKEAPSNFVEEQFDDVTGKTVGWEPASQSPYIKYISEAIKDLTFGEPWTYELCGPKINGNPDNFERHSMIPHGYFHVGPEVRSYDTIREFLMTAQPPIEGLVYHHEDGRMVKIKTRDFPKES